MDVAQEICGDLEDDWFPIVYASFVREERTRSIRLDVSERLNRPEIQHTLLGIDLKVGNRRFYCPDLATARYLRVFARIGCREFAIPYDITKISGVADELENSWQLTQIFIRYKLPGVQLKTLERARSIVMKAIRESVYELGAGDTMPRFDRETRLRPQ